MGLLICSPRNLTCRLLSAPDAERKSRAVWRREGASVNPPTSGCEVAADECEAECEISSHVQASVNGGGGGGGLTFSCHRHHFISVFINTRGTASAASWLTYVLPRRRRVVCNPPRPRTPTSAVLMRFHRGGTREPRLTQMSVSFDISVWTYCQKKKKKTCNFMEKSGFFSRTEYIDSEHMLRI